MYVVFVIDIISMNGYSYQTQQNHDYRAQTMQSQRSKSGLTQEWKLFTGGNIDFDDNEDEIDVRKARLVRRLKFTAWVLVAVAIIGGIIAVGVVMGLKSNGSKDKNNSSDTQKDGSDYANDLDSIVQEGLGNAITDKDKSSAKFERTDEDGMLEVMTDPPFDVPKGWTALWWDEFDGNALNSKFWSFDYGYGQVRKIHKQTEEKEMHSLVLLFFQIMH